MNCRHVFFAAIAAVSLGAQAADWSDTALTYRYGNKFAEPFGSNDITKNILGLSHVSGYKYGTNFFNADLLMSNEKDPAYKDAKTGAQEVYVVYRNTLDLEKVTGTSYKMSGVRGLGVTGGFDFNSKADASYNSKKRMVAIGPTVMFDVPGFLNMSLLGLWESNAPSGFSRYSYKAHPMLNFAWAIPFNAGIPLSFEGYANFIASKAQDEFGVGTAPETNIDMQVMYDISGQKTFKVGFEYQYWKNKFGNKTTALGAGGAGPGATAKTPMLRAEYHF